MRTTPRFKACIFDLDGTLLNTLATVLRHCNNSLAHYGYAPIDEAQCMEVCRLPAPDFYRVLLEMAGCPAPEADKLKEELAALDQKSYLDDPVSGTAPYPGMPETLAALRAAGVKTAILTNKPMALAQRVADATLPGLFHHIAGPRPGGIVKPDPRTLERVMETLGVNKEESVFVGDTDVDMNTGKNAGVYLAAVNWGFMAPRLLAAYQPDIMLEKPEDLLPLFGIQS